MFADEANPYRPATPNVFSGDRSLLKPWAKWVMLALGLASVGMFLGGLTVLGFSVATHFRDNNPPVLFFVGMASVFAGSMLINVKAVLGLYWLYQAWSWLPPEQRYTRHWKSWITPGVAACILLIPYFNYYWMFVINCGLCDALDRMRVSYRADPAPKGIAIAAGICQLIAFPVAPFVWFAFMNAVDKCMLQMMGDGLSERGT
jgi:hypothetical protein